MENNNQQNKKWLALLCSFLVCVLGAIVWGILYVEGWFASPVAYFTAFGAFFVYEKFNKEVTKKSFAWVLVWVIVLNAMASFIAMVVAVAIEAEVAIDVALNAILSVIGQIFIRFVIDIVLGTVFGVLGVVSCYKYLKRKQQTNIAQIQEDIQNNNEVVEGNKEKNENLDTNKCSQCGAEISGESDTCEFCGSKKQ